VEHRWSTKTTLRIIGLKETVQGICNECFFVSHHVLTLKRTCIDMTSS